MKKLTFLLAALALAAPVLQAKVYDITLTNADKYTQCHVRYKGSTSTKFSGTDKKGQVVTLEVPTSSILMMKEVEKAQAPATDDDAAKPADTQKPAETDKPADDAKPEADKPAEGDAAEGDKPAEGEAKEGDKPADQAPAPQQPEAETDGNPIGDQVQNATVQLRAKLAQIDAEMEGVRNPSPNLLHKVKNTKEGVARHIEELDKLALTVAETQAEYNSSCRGAYEFTIVPHDNRDQYVRDGKAAHKAMLIDMKEKPNKRKVAGLDKFEIMRERYQGIPEYKEAYEWYIRTMKELEKKWGKMLEKEQARRKSLKGAKKADMDAADDKEFERLSAEFKKDGENIDTVWYAPTKRNLRMLNHSYNRVHDTLRRNEDNELDPAVGTVPALLEQFWQNMDKVRDLMMAGRIEQAEELLKEDTSFRELVKLKTSIFPNDYRRPVMDQHQDLEKELKKRARAHRSLQHKLERQAASLESAIGNAEARIGALMEDIQREKGDDAGENTVDMNESMKDDAE